MTLPTDLQHQVAQRADQPGFDEVLVRAAASRRRRRTTIASGLAAAVLVVGAVALPALLPTGDDRSAPEPASPGLTDDRLPADVQDLLGQEEVHPWTVAGSGDGVAVLWRSCPGEGLDQPCSFVLTTRRGDDVSGTAVRGDHPRLTAVPSGWLLETDGSFDIVLAGGDRPVVDTGPRSADVVAGDTAVETDDGLRLLRGTTLLPLPVPPESELWAAHVTPEGRLVAVTGQGGGVSISATDDGRTWERTPLLREDGRAVSALVAGSGDHDAVGRQRAGGDFRRTRGDFSGRATGVGQLPLRGAVVIAGHRGSNGGSERGGLRPRPLASGLGGGNRGIDHAPAEREFGRRPLFALGAEGGGGRVAPRLEFGRPRGQFRDLGLQRVDLLLQLGRVRHAGLRLGEDAGEQPRLADGLGVVVPRLGERLLLLRAGRCDHL
jgi:hypothetical protein